MKSVINWFRGLIRSTHSNTQARGAETSRVATPAIPKQRSYTNPPVHLEEKEPVLVRGKLWKNTTEDTRELPPANEAPCSSAVDDLIKGLGRFNRAELRRTSAESLGKLGYIACPAISALVNSSIDIDATVRQAALNALDEIDPAWPGNAETQKAIPNLVESLKSWSVDISKAAIHTLAIIGLPIVAELNDGLLNGDDTIEKVYAIQLLSQLGPDAWGAVPGLSQALKSKFLRVRIAAAEALSNFGPRAEMAIPALIMNLTDPVAESRQAMATCLCQIGPAAEPAIPALVPLLADRRQEVREVAVLGLKRMGAKVIPAMIEIVQSRDARRMRMWVESTNRALPLVSHAHPTVMAVDLGQVLNNLSWTAYDILEEQESLEAAQESAIRILGELGAASEAVVRTIAGALADPNVRIKLAAIQALGQIRAPAEVICLNLSVALLDPNPLVRNRAAKAISEINIRAAVENSRAIKQ